MITNVDQDGRYTPFENNTTVSMTVEPQFNNVTIAASRNLNKVTNRYGQTVFDLSEYNYQLNPNDVAWNFKGTCTTDGWDVGQFSGHKEAGANDLYVVVKRSPSGAAPPPTEPGPIAPSPIPEIKLPSPFPQISGTTILIGIVVIGLIALFLFMPMSPAPAERIPRIRARGPQVKTPEVEVG